MITRIAAEIWSSPDSHRSRCSARHTGFYGIDPPGFHGIDLRHLRHAGRDLRRASTHALEHPQFGRSAQCAM